MAFESFRDFVAQLDRAGELIACGLYNRAVIRIDHFAGRMREKSV
ncbi:MAG: hypothetical protein ABSH15_01255 [Verrucomicrobiota bacterium]